MENLVTAVLFFFSVQSLGCYLGWKSYGNVTSESENDELSDHLKKDMQLFSVCRNVFFLCSNHRWVVEAEQYSTLGGAEANTACRE